MKMLKVKRSSIHGLGVILEEPVKRGEIIYFLRGKIRRMNVKSTKDSLSHACWIGIGKGVWIEPIEYGRYTNHSCSPSAGIRGKTTIVALHNLKAGNEVTIDYSTIEGDERWKMKCRCGEKNCRKIIRSVEFLPKKTFKHYLPFVPTYFKELYIKNHRDK